MKRITFSFTLFMLFLMMSRGYAQNVLEVTVNEPGTLSKQLEGKNPIEKLIVKGKINATDFNVLKTYKDLVSIDLSSVVIEDGGRFTFNGITSPGRSGYVPDGSFMGLKKLGSIQLPETTTELGDFVCTGTSIEQFYIPASLKTIGNCDFYLCNNLKEFIISPQNKFFMIDRDVCIYSKDLKKCFAYAPACEKHKTYTLKEGVKELVGGAFSGNAYLERVELPQSLETIGGMSFCFSMIKDIVIPPNVTEIGSSTFFGCKQLTKVQLSDRITYLRDQVFINCTALSQLNFPKSLKGIGYKAFKACEALPSMTFPPTLEEIGPYAFQGCLSFTKLTIPSSLNAMDKGAFSRCKNLTSVTFEGILHELPEEAFDVCSKLNHIVFPKDLSKIGKNAFYSSAFIDLSIPEKVTEIGASAFNENVKLANLTLPSTLKKIDDFAFRNCMQLLQVSIPSSVVSIGVGAFSWCENLQNIVLHDGIEKIDNNAFARCPIGSIKLPSTIHSISRATFAHCTKLKEIAIPGNVNNIDLYAFANCISLKKVRFEGDPVLVDSVFYQSENITLVDYMGTTPRMGGNDCFSQAVYNTATLTAKEETLPQLKKTAPWMFFKKQQLSTSPVNREFPYYIENSHLVARGEKIVLFDMNGNKIAEARDVLDMELCPSSYYLLQIDGKTFKINNP